MIDTFGQVLSEARLHAGFSQEDLAFEAGIDRTFVGRIERGQRQATLSVLFALARALRLQPDELITRTLQRLVN